MAFKWDKVTRPRNTHALVRGSEAGKMQSHQCGVHGFTIRNHAVPSMSERVVVDVLAGDHMWKHAMSLPRDHARALAYLLLLATSGPLERAAVIADAKAEGLEIGGIT